MYGIGNTASNVITSPATAHRVGDIVVPIYDADLDPADQSGPGRIVRVRGMLRWVEHLDGQVAMWVDYELAPAAAEAFRVSPLAA
jgi:hypothetical protein